MADIMNRMSGRQQFLNNPSSTVNIGGKPTSSPKESPKKKKKKIKFRIKEHVEGEIVILYIFLKLFVLTSPFLVRIASILSARSPEEVFETLEGRDHPSHPHRWNLRLDLGGHAG